MTILITGAGMIGCYFAREMARRGRRVVLYDAAPNADYVRFVAGETPVVKGDIRDLPALVDVMREYSVDTVFHSAAMISRSVAENPYSGLSVNIGGATAVSEASRLCGVRRLVFSSSVVAYRWSLRPVAPVDEDFPLGDDDFYGNSKVACEQVLHAYGARYGIEVAVLRFPLVYGHGLFAGGARGGIAPHRIAEDAARGRPVRIDPALFNTTEHLYVKDAVQGVALACERPFTAKAFNIGAGIVTGPADLAHAVRAACPGLDVAVLPGSSEHPGHQKQPLDLTRARKELGYEPQFDLVKGMADFIQELQRT
ncbi:MAG: NAD(P)-dependent oxidoreductase [Dehalococcoidia bacterium]|nr:NAD(P)-dependent oxidoreductase [Dehalococcoidia bacterium]